MQIEREFLAVGERAPQVHADTQAAQLMMWVKGFLDQDSCAVGQVSRLFYSPGRSGRIIYKAIPAYWHYRRQQRSYDY